MDIFRIRFINKENKESTVIILSNINEQTAIEMAKMWLKNMNLPFSVEKQEVICDRMRTDVPNVLTFSMA